MIVETTVNGRPAQAMYMTDDFEPVDNELLATLVKVTFLDAEGGAMFLVPKSHSDTGKVKETNRAEATSAFKSRSLPAHELFKVRVWLGLQGIKFDPDQPRDEEGKWTSGGGGRWYRRRAR